MKTKKKLLVFFSILMLLSISISAAMAYSLIGGKWRTNNIQFTDNTTTYYAWAAARDWDNPSGLTNNITLTASSGTNFSVAETYRYDVPWDGICMSSISGGYFNFAYIYDNTYYTSPYSASKHQGVITHEFGHGLGLSDLYGPVMAVMQGYTNLRSYTTVQSDDNNGINYLYR